MGNVSKHRNMILARQNAEVFRVRVLAGPDKGFVFVVTNNRATIGRGNENDIILSDLKVSRAHAVITLNQGQAFVEDVGGAHGVLVNGRAFKNTPIRSADKVAVGESILEYIGPETATTFLTTAPQTQNFADYLSKSAKVDAAVASDATMQAAAVIAKKPMTFIERNRKLVLLLAGFMALSIFMPEVEKKTRKQRQVYVEPKDIEADRSVSGVPTVKLDEGRVKAAEASFREGMREYRSQHWIRARVAFETALQIHPEHSLARVYLESTKKTMADEAKELMLGARRDEEANRLDGALKKYEAVIRMYGRDREVDQAKEAVTRKEELVRRISEAKN